MADNDNKNIKLITEFLNEEGIKFLLSIPKDDDTQAIFTLNGINNQSIEVRYVNSFTHKMDYTERFGIKGIAHKYFIDLSHSNHDKGIRTIWIKILKSKIVKQLKEWIMKKFQTIIENGKY